MTTRCAIKPVWKGETVAVLASGPSMSAEVVKALKRYRCIAVNHTHKIAPNADMMIALDRNLALWESAKNFKGIKVCGVECDDIDARYHGQMYERVKLNEHQTIEVHNSGLAAIRLAQKMGAGRILLAGFDPESAPPGKYIGLVEGLRAISAELSASGVTVERFRLFRPALQYRGSNVS